MCGLHKAIRGSGVTRNGRRKLRLMMSAAAFAASIAACSAAQAQSLNGWTITGVTPPNDTGVVFVVVDSPQIFAVNTVTASKAMNLAAGSYNLTYQASGAPSGSPPADYESLTPSISGSGSGTVLVNPRNSIASVFSDTGTSHTDTFTVTTPGAKTLTFSFVGNGPNCTNSASGGSICGIFLDLGGVTLTLASLDSILPFLSDAPQNVQNVAKAIDPFRNNPAFSSGFLALYSLGPAGLVGGFKQVDGEAGATGGAQSFNQMTNQFLSLLLSASSRGRGSDAGGDPVLAFASEPARQPALAAFAKAPLAPRDIDKRWSVWGAGYGGDARVSGDATAGSTETSVRTYGVAAGADYRAGPDSLVGFALAGGGTRWGLMEGLGGGTSDAFQAGIYGTARFGNSYLSAAASYSFFDVATDRTVTVAGIDRLTASYDAHALGGRLEAGHRFETAFANVTPYAAVQAQAAYIPGYSEQGGTANQFALTYSSQTATVTRSELGSWISSRELNNTTLFARAAWAHDWRSDGSISAMFQSLPGSSFVVTGATPPSDLALLTAGAKFRVNDSVTLSAKFDGEFAEGYRSYGVTGTFRYAWN